MLLRILFWKWGEAVINKKLLLINDNWALYWDWCKCQKSLLPSAVFFWEQSSLPLAVLIIIVTLQAGVFGPCLQIRAMLGGMLSLALESFTCLWWIIPLLIVCLSEYVPLFQLLHVSPLLFLCTDIGLAFSSVFWGWWHNGLLTIGLF